MALAVVALALPRRVPAATTPTRRSCTTGAPAQATTRAGQYGGADSGTSDFGPEGHAPGEYGSDVYTAGDYWPGNDRSGDYRPADQRSAEYDDYSRSGSARHRTEHYEPADYGQPDYDQDGEWWPDSDQADRTGQPFVPADGVGYGEQRFAPPYGRPQPDSSEARLYGRLGVSATGRSRRSLATFGGSAQRRPRVVTGPDPAGRSRAVRDDFVL